MTPETRRLVMDAVLELRNPLVTALFALVDEVNELEMEKLDAECQRLHEELTEERAMEERPELIEAEGEESDQIDRLPGCKCSLIRTESVLADGRTQIHVVCPTCGDNWVESPEPRVICPDCEAHGLEYFNVFCSLCNGYGEQVPLSVAEAWKQSRAKEVQQTVQVAEDTSSEGGEAAIVPPSSQGDSLHHAPLSDEVDPDSILGRFDRRMKGESSGVTRTQAAAEGFVVTTIDEKLSEPVAPEVWKQAQAVLETPAPVLIETKPRAGLESLGSVEYLLISLDPEETVNVHRLHAAGVHRRYQALRNRIKRFKPQSVVAAITAAQDGMAKGTIRATFEPVCPDELFKDMEPFLDVWAKYLKTLSHMQVRDEKARLVARLTSMKGER